MVHVDWLFLCERALCSRQECPLTDSSFVSEPSAAGRTTESSAPIAVVQLLSRVGLLATPKLNFFKNWSQSSQTLLLLYQLSSCNILKVSISTLFTASSLELIPSQEATFFAHPWEATPHSLKILSWDWSSSVTTLGPTFSSLAVSVTSAITSLKSWTPQSYP